MGVWRIWRHGFVRATVWIVRLGPLTDAQPSSSIHAAVPPVLDCIVAPAMESSGNLGPSFAHVSNETFDEFTFFRCDGLVIKCWFEVLVIPFTALLG